MGKLDDVVQQALVHAVVDSAYGVGLVDENARFLYVNPAGCEILGQEAEQLLEHNDVVTALTTRADTQPTTLALLDRTSHSRTAAITRPDGAIREIDATLTRVYVNDRRLSPCCSGTSPMRGVSNAGRRRSHGSHRPWPQRGARRPS